MAREWTRKRQKNWLSLHTKSAPIPMLFGATSRLGPPFRLVEQDQSRLETEAELVPCGKGGQNHQSHLERMHVIALRPSGSAQQPSRNQTQTPPHAHD